MHPAIFGTSMRKHPPFNYLRPRSETPGGRIKTYVFDAVLSYGCENPVYKFEILSIFTKDLLHANYDPKSKRSTRVGFI